MDIVLWLSLAGALAGAMNALAGGGSFVTLFALTRAGLPSIVANASSTVALYPGSLVSSWAYRKELRSPDDGPLAPIIIINMIGGLAGALLLLATPERLFDMVVPWLLLFATLSFIAGRRVGDALRERIHVGRPAMLVLQFILGAYGGYFGGGVGIMTMAVWGLVGTMDLKEMNPAKTVAVAASNTIAVVCFIVARQISWHETIIILVSGVIGGYVGAHLGRRLPAGIVRLCVIAISIIVTVAFFLKSFRYAG